MFELRINGLLPGVRRRLTERPHAAKTLRFRGQGRAGRGRHFRAYVFWTLACITIMQTVLGAAIDIGLPSVRDPEYAHREAVLLARLAENRGKPIVMVLGSSRVLNGLDAQTASHLVGDRALVFNLGIPASGPFLDKVWLERLESRGIKPDVLFIEVVGTHFASDGTPPDQRSLDGARLSLSEMAEIPATQSALTGPVRRWAIGRVLPTFRHQAELRALLGIDEHAHGAHLHRDLASIDNYGWAARNDYNPALKQLAHDQYDGFFRDFRLSPMQVDLLEQNIAACQRRGIKTILLLTPEGSEFRNQYTPAMSAAIKGMLAQLHERFHVQVVDARDWVDDAKFVDMHHLRRDGAQIFTERLAREAIEPLLRDRETMAGMLR
jgi:hypothetical protein